VKRRNYTFTPVAKAFGRHGCAPRWARRSSLCAVAGGEIGTVITALLKHENLRVRTVTRETDSGWYVHDRRDGQRTAVVEHPGVPLGRHDLDELYTSALAEGLRARVSVLSGAAGPRVVRPDVYRRLATDRNAHGTSVVANLSGDHLTAVLAGGVTFLKVGHDELIEAGRAADDSGEALLEAAHRLARRALGQY
jgi:1-phosphofructokinase